MTAADHANTEHRSSADIFADEIERLWAEREQIDGECLVAIGTEEHVLASRIRDILRQESELREAAEVEIVRLTELNARERKARKAAEELNADAVVAARTNLEARAEAAEAERDLFLRNLHLKDKEIERLLAAEAERDQLADAARGVLDYENTPSRKSLSDLRDALARTENTP